MGGKQAATEPGTSVLGNGEILLPLEGKPRKTGFWTSPRKTRLRWWIFYIHFFAGLIAGLLFSIVGITGSAIVFVPELRVLEVPGHAVVRPAGKALPFQLLAEKVQASRPRDDLDSFTSASERDSFELTPGKALNFRTFSPRGDRIQTFINQYTGEILAQYNYSHRFLQKIYDLHDNLLGGLTGRKINAWFAALMMIMSVAGMLLWWRGSKSWTLGLQYKFRAGWKRQNWDLHNLGGFLLSLPLLALALTGIYYSYESQFAAAAAVLTGGPATVPVPRVSPAKRLPVDDIIRSAERAAPDCPPTLVQFPKSVDDSFVIRVHCPGDPHAIGLSYVYVNPTTAQIIGVDRFSSAQSGVRLIRLMTPIHYGDVGGLFTRVLWVVFGLVPAGLFVTGLLMWWNRSLGRDWRHFRSR